MQEHMQMLPLFLVETGMYMGCACLAGAARAGHAGAWRCPVPPAARQQAQCMVGCGGGVQGRNKMLLPCMPCRTLLCPQQHPACWAATGTAVHTPHATRINTLHSHSTYAPNLGALAAP
jgi:hypothetical protein